MKTNRGFTIVQLTIVIVFFAIAMILIPAVTKSKQIVQERQKLKLTGKDIQVGDTVTIDGMDVVAKINRIRDFGIYDLLVRSTNGMVSSIERVDAALLTKVTAVEK